MRTVLAVLAATVLAGGAAADDDAAKAKAVVEKAVKAAGWDKHGADVNQTWKDKGTLALGDDKISYTGEWWFSGPDKLRFDVTIDLGGTATKFSALVNGEKGWQAMGDTWEELKDEKLEYTRNQAHLYCVLTLSPLLADKGFTLKPIAGIKVGDAETTGVEVSHKDRPAVKLYFDAKTDLLAGAEMKVKNEFEGWAEATDVYTLGGWKEENKKKVSTKMTITRNGKPMIETEETDHKYPDKLDAKLFERSDK